MAMGLMGKKIGMSQIFDQEGNLVPVTVLEMGPNTVVQVKRDDGPDGYNAVKLGYGDVKPERMNRPDLGVFRKAGVDPTKHLREFRVDSDELADISVGDTLDVGMFERGSNLDVTGTSKGRGYQGVVKRHGFKGAKEMTHGTHEYKRHAGSIGCSAWPARVIKGKKMAGQMGSVRVTTRAVRIEAIYPDQNLLLVRGSIPGAKNGLVMVQPSTKQPAFLE